MPGELLNPKAIFETIDLAEGMKVGDLGCGNSGYFTFIAARIVGEKGTVYAVDVQKTVVENIKHQAEWSNVINIVPIWSNLEIYQATKIPDGTLDMALLTNVLHQSQKRSAIVKEATRMLKSGGKLLVTEWKRSHIPFGPSVELRVNKEEVITTALHNGLNLEKDFEAGPYHFGLLFIKQ